MDWREARLGGQVGPGWEPLVDELHAQVLELEPTIVVSQVKEKFGGLRYYVQLAPESNSASHLTVNSLIDEYEARSFKTCEWCGAPGTTEGDGWAKTLCPTHREAWDEGKRWW